MNGKTDASAHDYAVDQRYIGFSIMLNEGIETVFVPPVGQRLVDAPSLVEIIEGAQIAARGKGPLARGGDNHARDRAIVRPVGKLSGKAAHHRVGDRVERLRPVEGDKPGSAATVEKNFSVRRHAAGRRAANQSAVA